MLRSWTQDSVVKATNSFHALNSQTQDLNTDERPKMSKKKFNFHLKGGKFTCFFYVNNI